MQSSWQFFCFISLLHAGYTEGLGALCAACDATRWDKEQTNIRAALSNPDQSVCQGPDKLTGRRGQREVEGVGCGDVSLLTLKGTFSHWAQMAMNITTPPNCLGTHSFWTIHSFSPHFIQTDLTMGQLYQRVLSYTDTDERMQGNIHLVESAKHPLKVHSSCWFQLFLG